MRNKNISSFAKFFKEQKKYASAYHELMDATQNESVALDEIVDIVNKYPALISALLRSINSVGHSVEYRIKEVRSAIRLLGFRRLLNIAFIVRDNTRNKSSEELITEDTQNIYIIDERPELVVAK
ncbi:MAG: HDOD domain-containing protein [Planctomycetes bacterium]|nr:HDOD domain-containing protein [Planctomycetota bacterium]